MLCHCGDAQRPQPQMACLHTAQLDSFAAEGVDAGATDACTKIKGGAASFIQADRQSPAGPDVVDSEMSQGPSGCASTMACADLRQSLNRPSQRYEGHTETASRDGPYKDISTV